MASFGFEGFEELNKAFKKSAQVPDDVKTKMLKEMAEIAAKAEKEIGESKGVRDPESGEHILDKIKINSPKLTDDGGSISITFSGTRKRGKTSTRNAEIAFVNEFGKKGQAARPFISTALKQKEKEMNEAGLKTFHEWFDKTYES